MHILILAAALAATVQPADPFCDNIRTLAEGATESDPFRSLRNRDFAPRLGRAYCSFSDAGGYACGHSLATREETRETYAARIQACLPGAVRSNRREHGFLYEVVTRGPFEARVTERGADRGHVGRSIDIYIHRVGPALRPAD